MANFKSVITDQGRDLVKQILANDGKLILTRAEIGDGILSSSLDAHTLQTLLNQTAAAQLGGKQLAGGQVRIPVQMTNGGLTSSITIREVGIFAQSELGEVLFAYAYTTDADDALNTLSPPVPGVTGFNQVRIIDMHVYLDSIEYTSIEVKISSSALVTWDDVVGYAAKIVHTHTADEIMQSNGFTVEEWQEEQDKAIKTLTDKLDSGTNSGVTAEIKPVELKWAVLNNMGIYDLQRKLFYA